MLYPIELWVQPKSGERYRCEGGRASEKCEVRSAKGEVRSEKVRSEKVRSEKVRSEKVRKGEGRSEKGYFLRLRIEPGPDRGIIHNHPRILLGPVYRYLVAQPADSP